MEADAPVRKQVGRGVATLIVRTAVLTPVSFAASVLLARWLPPADFGAFISVAFLVLGLGSLFELGLVSVLVQQREVPTVREQRTVFTAYVVLFLAVAVVVVGAAPWLAEAFRLPPDGASMLRWMTLPMVLGVFGCIPTVMLEREVRFGAITVAEVGSVLLEKGVALWLAYHGHGAWSLVWGALAAVSLRLVVLNLASPWALGFAFDRALLQARLAHGVWFQGVNLAYLARENLNTLLGGPGFGPHGVGLLNWSANLAALVPSNAIQVAHRVTFPGFARLLDEPEEASRLLRSTLRRLVLLAAPPMLAIWVLSDVLVRHVYGEAWREALPLLGWAVARMAASLLFTPLLVFVNARGEAAMGFRFILASTVTEWGLALVGALLFGVVGVAAGAALGVLPALAWLVAWVHRRAALQPLATLGPGLVLTAVTAAVAAALAPHVGSWQALLGAVGVLALAWGLPLAWLERPLLRATLARWRGPGSGGGP